LQTGRVRYGKFISKIEPHAGNSGKKYHFYLMMFHE